MKARHRTLAIASLAVALHTPSAADDAVWTNRTTGTTQRWDVPGNWLPNAVPDAVGQSVIITQDLATAGQTIGIYAPTTTVGRIVLGDGVGAGNNYAYTIRGDIVARAIRFEQPGDAPAMVEMHPGGGTPTHTLDVTTHLASDLVITNAGTQHLLSSRPMDVGGRTLQIVGTGLGNVSYNGDLIGAGRIEKTSAGVLNINTTVKGFTGDLQIDNGSLTIVSGSLRNARDLFVSGVLTNSMAALGGAVVVGSNSPYTTNPGQRLPTRLLTLSGGRLVLDGQPSDGSWADAVKDSVQILSLPASYNNIMLTVRALSGGTELEAGVVERARGATVYVRGVNTLGSTGKVILGNAASLLVGNGGGVGSKDRSIIPWIGARYTNADGNNLEGFATYDTSTGVRILTDATELQTNINNALPGENVRVGDFALTANKSVNSLAMTGYHTSTLGAGNTLTVSSGALYLTRARIDRYGLSTVGTLNFGAAEGIVFVGDGTQYASIAATIAGSGGLTKTAVGALTLAGANTYSGPTHVGAGTLQVGGSVYDSNGVLLDSGTVSNLGNGDVDVHPGAKLRIACAAAIPDTASVTLRRTGLFRRSMEIDTGLNETVQHLYLGDEPQVAGTYGGTSSAATTKDDRYFAGTGVLNVLKTAGAGPTPTLLLLR